MAKQTLQQAIHLARTGKSRDLARAATVLDGCPVGGWGETQQAKLEIHGLLPSEGEREYTVEQFVGATYDARGSHYRARA